MHIDLFTLWFLLIGVLLIGIALAGTLVKRLPLTTSLLYLGVGVILGPQVLGLLRVDPVTHSGIVERLAEVAVIVSLFTAGLKLRVPVSDPRWLIPLRLAVTSMALTVAMIAAVCVYLLQLPLGVGIVLGAVLAPTDPVLASDVQVEHPFDNNRLRFGLTGEASLNDGTAFPFLMLGLAVLGLDSAPFSAWRWLGVDVVWAVAVGILIGGILGTLVGHFVLYLRRTHKEAVGLDDFLALGLIALAYGAALACHAYGFLAVFAAGLALRRIERLASPPGRHKKAESLASAGVSAEDLATHHEHGPAYMANAVLAFNEQLERIGELAVVVTVGAMLSVSRLDPEMLWFMPLLFLIIRPVSTVLGLAGSELTRREHLLIGWFGIRGIGSVYYLMFAINHGLPTGVAVQVTNLTLMVIALSIVAHGMSVTPLMRREGSPVQGS